MTTEKEFEELILRYFRKEIGYYYPSFNSDSGAWTDFITELEENCLDKQKTLNTLKSSKTIKEALERLQNGDA